MSIFLLRVIGIIFAFSSTLVSSDQLLVVGETGELLLTPSLQVKCSPDQGVTTTTTLCERIHIHGYPRFHHHLDKYAHSLKLIVNASSADHKTSIIHVCFHGNFSLAIGMCPQDRWEKISNGSWIKTMSLFDHRIIDVRIASPSKITLQVSTVQEWFRFRIVFLVSGTVLLIWASTLSKSMSFYYITVLIVGVVIVALLLLSQVVKDLQAGLSSWKLFLYSSMFALTYFYLPYTPSRFESMLRLLGCKPGSEEAFLLVLLMGLHKMGVILGLPAINSHLLLTPDDSIDTGTSLFMSWSIWILAGVLILQSSGDGLFALGALIFLIIMSPMIRRFTGLILPQRVREVLMNLLLRILEGIGYVVGPTVLAYACDFLQRFVSILKGIEPCKEHLLQLNPNQTYCTCLAHNLNIDMRLTTLVGELPTFSNDVTNNMLAMKQAQDVLIQAIKNQPSQNQNLQLNQTYYYTCLASNLEMDLTNFVREFRTFSNYVARNMLLMKRDQNELLRANGIDPETLLPMVPPAN